MNSSVWLKSGLRELVEIRLKTRSESTLVEEEFGLKLTGNSKALKILEQRSDMQ